MSGSSAYFDELEEKLLIEQGFAVLRPDLLSHGQSHRAMGSKAVMKQYNNAIAAFIKSRGQDLDAGRVGIYGFSFGAYLALRAALQSDLRSMVKSLVLMNPPTDETFSRSRIFQWHEGLLRELFPVEDFQRLVDKTQTLKLPLTEFLDSLSDEERRIMAAGTLVFLSTNDETIHFKDQSAIRGFGRHRRAGDPACGTRAFPGRIVPARRVRDRGPASGPHARGRSADGGGSR